MASQVVLSKGEDHAITDSRQGKYINTIGRKDRNYSLSQPINLIPQSCFLKCYKESFIFSIKFQCFLL